MTRIWADSARLAAFAAAGLSFGACQSVAPPAGPSTPINECPANECAAFSSSSGVPATCVGGACVVAQPAQKLVMVISLSQDSGFAPARTFAVLYNTLAATMPVSTASVDCDAGGCAALPGFASPEGQYVVSPSETQPFPLGVGWNLGNSSFTGLPVEVTYRLQWPVAGSSSATTDAQSLGLPVPPVQAVTSFNSNPWSPPPDSPSTGQGSQGGIIYQTYLQAGVYQRIMMPTAPYDQKFPPDVQVLPVAAGGGSDQTPISLDSTKSETGLGPTIPVFDISSLAGPMDGWSAYLRDNTGLTISNVVALHGTESPQVVLATAHVAPMVDALQNAALVIAPPAGVPMPAGVFAPNGNTLPSALTYPQLPAPVTVTGSVVTTEGAAVPAQVVFEAHSITATSPQGTNVADTRNFEFTGYASAAVDASGAGGAATYSIVLPQGTYRVSVRPLTTASEVTILDPAVIDDTSSGGLTLTVDVQRTARGTAVVADGRPLAGATIDLLPIGCADNGTAANPIASSTWCLPRPLQAPTANDGSFQFAVDPGAFYLRVKPADGSRLPWVVQPLSIAAGSAPMVIPPLTVPAPTSVGLSLVDPVGNALIHAVVRAFWLPDQGSAYELGNAVTGVDGRYDMYLAIPSQ